MAIIEETEENSLTPIIKWAQSDLKLIITAELSDVKVNQNILNFVFLLTKLWKVFLSRGLGGGGNARLYFSLLLPGFEYDSLW